MVKVDVISGFLGAGKTTLIKKLFESVLKNEKVVLIENEFGEIGIDGTFLQDSGIQIKEINAGCICCSLVGDFATSMAEVINTYNPERIIIEPSGVGKLSDIVNAVIDLNNPDIKVNILATVVDGPKTKMYLKNFGEFFNNQVEAANTVIISKVDKMDEAKLAEVVVLVKQKNDHATIITTAINDLDSEELVKVLESKLSLQEELKAEMEYVHDHEEDECCCGHHHHHHDEDEEEHECCCGHHHHHDDDDDDDEDEHECCCGHHHHHDDDDDDDEDEHECCCGHHHNHEEHEHHHHHDEDEEEHECCCGHHHDHEEHEHHHHHHHHDADEIFTSWGKETPKSVTKEKLEAFLHRLATDEDLGIIVRSKGVIKAADADNWYYYDFVSGDYEIRFGTPSYTGRIVVIGSKVNEHEIEEMFEELVG